MKKKLLILSASISLLLACFPFTLCAEEDPESDFGISSPPAYYQLDDYFYENYQLYPYIESTGSQYIDTGIKSKSNLFIRCDLSNFINGSTFTYLYGAMDNGNPLTNGIGVSSFRNEYSGSAQFKFDSQSLNYTADIANAGSYFISQKNNICMINGSVVNEFTDSTFTGNNNIYIFARNNAGSPQNYSSYRLSTFAIYDYDQDQYVRYFYPAKSLSSDTLGLYDAVSKTFFTSLSASQFVEPSGNIAEAGIMSKVGSFMYSGLGWIGDILAFAIAEPVIIFFMAIGLAGAMFRWGRKLVHF